MRNTEDTEALLAKSTEVASSDWRDEEADDKYITARLYKAADGRHFRFVETSGMNTRYSGAGRIVEWLTPGEVDSWNRW